MRNIKSFSMRSFWRVFLPAVLFCADLRAQTALDSLFGWFNDSSLVTVPVTGGWEYDGHNYFFSCNGKRYLRKEVDTIFEFTAAHKAKLDTIKKPGKLQEALRNNKLGWYLLKKVTYADSLVHQRLSEVPADKQDSVWDSLLRWEEMTVTGMFGSDVKSMYSHQSQLYTNQRQLIALDAYSRMMSYLHYDPIPPPKPSIHDENTLLRWPKIDTGLDLGENPTIADLLRAIAKRYPPEGRYLANPLNSH